MIRVTFKLTSDHLITAFQMAGHADAGPYGQDIVLLHLLYQSQLLMV